MMVPGKSYEHQLMFSSYLTHLSYGLGAIRRVIGGDSPKRHSLRLINLSEIFRQLTQQYLDLPHSFAVDPHKADCLEQITKRIAEQAQLTDKTQTLHYLQQVGHLLTRVLDPPSDQAGYQDRLTDFLGVLDPAYRKLEEDFRNQYPPGTI